MSKRGCYNVAKIKLEILKAILSYFKYYLVSFSNQNSTHLSGEQCINIHRRHHPEEGNQEPL